MAQSDTAGGSIGLSRGRERPRAECDVDWKQRSKAGMNTLTRRRIPFGKAVTGSHASVRPQWAIGWLASRPFTQGAFPYRHIVSAHSADRRESATPHCQRWTRLYPVSHSVLRDRNLTSHDDSNIIMVTRRLMFGGNATGVRASHDFSQGAVRMTMMRELQSCHGQYVSEVCRGQAHHFTLLHKISKF
jgi:hypothetical protein